MTSTTALVATGPARLVGFRLNNLNAPVYRVTPLVDGMEHIEHLANSAYPQAYPEGLGFDLADVEWAEGRAAFYGIHTGTHRARVTQDPEQAALAARCSAQTGVPAKGDRYVVGTLTGYQLIQNRGLDHRHCGCGNGVTTYAEGTVTSLTHWADNSIDVHVQLDDGTSKTVQAVAPHGDACF